MLRAVINKLFAPSPESRLLTLLGQREATDNELRAAAGECRGLRDLARSLASEWVIDLDQGRREPARRKRVVLEVLG